MKTRISVPLGAMLAIIPLAAAQMAYYAPLLPERIATHFGATGQPNGWMTKEAFLTSYAVLLLFDALMLGGIALALPKMPTETINLPNKEFWLAPERREATMRFVSEQMLWFGVATQALLVGIMQSVFQANLTPAPSLGGDVWIFLVGYLAYTGFWTVGLVRRFRLPD